MRKFKRNDPCPCGSDKKYKKCCIDVKAKPVSRPHDPARARKSLALIALLTAQMSGRR